MKIKVKSLTYSRRIFVICYDFVGIWSLLWCKVFYLQKSVSRRRNERLRGRAVCLPFIPSSLRVRA